MSKIELLESINEGANDSYFCKFVGKRAFVKYYTKTPIRSTYQFLKSIDEGIHEYFREEVGPLSYRSSDMFHSHADKEVLTYDLWDESGINVPKILEFDDNHIVLDVIEGVSVGSVIKNKFDLGTLEKTLEVYDQTRFLGHLYENPIYFHSDPHLDNFMVLSNDGSIIPIDSSLKIRSDMDLHDVDSMINLYFAYQLLDRVSVYSDSEIKSVFNSYKYFLSNRDVEFLQKNAKPTRIYDAYCLAREEIAHRVKGRPKMKHSRIYGSERSSQLVDLIS
jgi:tRNA A-37 threonylcarbamoyl transferase component Bud32